MKMTKIAVAAVALSAGAAFAQDAKVFGTFDAAIATANNQGASGASVTRMVSAGDAPSVFGMTGSKKLANGMTASGYYEAGVNLQNGASGASANPTSSLFNRQAFVGLAGNFGKVTLGLQLDPAFIAELVTDPTGAKDISGGISAFLAGSATAAGIPAGGNAGNGAGTFTNSSLQYSNQFGPVGVTVGYGFGNTGNNTATNDTTVSAAAIYGGGPLTISAGVSNNSKSAAAGQDSSTTVVGAAYQLGAWRLAANYQDAKNSSGTVEFKTTGLGAIYGLSQATSIHLASFQTQSTTPFGNGNINVINLGVAHDLDKSVRLYAYLNTTTADNGLNFVGNTAGTWGSENAIGAFGAAAGKTVQTLYVGTRVSF
jgi:predicted porin